MENFEIKVEDPFHCSLCGEYFPYQSAFQLHMMAHAVPLIDESMSEVITAECTEEKFDFTTATIKVEVLSDDDCETLNNLQEDATSNNSDLNENNFSNEQNIPTSFLAPLFNCGLENNAMLKDNSSNLESSESTEEAKRSMVKRKAVRELKPLIKHEGSVNVPQTPSSTSFLAPLFNYDLENNDMLKDNSSNLESCGSTEETELSMAKMKAVRELKTVFKQEGSLDVPQTLSSTFIYVSSDSENSTSFGNKRRKVSNALTNERSTVIELSSDSKISSEMDSESSQSSRSESEDSSSNVNVHKCHNCKATFNYRTHLLNHLYDAHGLDKCLKCGICKYTTTSKQSLKTHIESHKTFTEKMKLKNRSVKSNINMNCVSNLSKSTTKNLEIEKIGVLNAFADDLTSMKKNCVDRGLNFEEMSSRKKLKTHGEIEPLRCSQCKFQTRSKTSMAYHERLHFKGGYKCSSCEKCFTDVKALTTHQKMHNKNGACYCKPCNKRFYKQELYLMHQDSHNIEGVYVCFMCYKEFKELTDLENHGHVFESFECDICFRVFDIKSKLEKHYKLHTSKSFQHDTSLHKCNKCYQTFATSKLLKQHRAQTFECSCIREFSTVTTTSNKGNKKEIVADYRDDQSTNNKVEISCSFARSSTTTIVRSVNSTVLNISSNSTDVTETNNEKSGNTHLKSILKKATGNEKKAGLGVTVFVVNKTPDISAAQQNATAQSTINYITNKSPFRVIAPKPSTLPFMTSSVPIKTVLKRLPVSATATRPGPKSKTLVTQSVTVMPNLPKTHEYANIGRNTLLKSTSSVLAAGFKPTTSSSSTSSVQRVDENTEIPTMFTAPITTSNTFRGNRLTINSSLTTKTLEPVEKDKPLIKRRRRNPDPTSKFFRRTRYGEMYKCVDCGKTLNCLQAWKEHRQSEHGDSKPFQCRVCDAKFEEYSGLKEHTLSQCQAKLNNMIYKCTECPYSFKSKSELQSHLNEHNAEKEGFQCTVCSVRFTNSVSLIEHQKFMHQKDFVLLICVKCRKYFTSKSDLAEHEKLTHAINYRCKLCPRTFDNFPEFLSHNSRHKDYTPFECNVCGMSFSTIKSKNRHVLCHKVSCEVCNLRCANLLALTIHMKEHETNENSKVKSAELNANTSIDSSELKDITSTENKQNSDSTNADNFLSFSDEKFADSIFKNSDITTLNLNSSFDDFGLSEIASDRLTPLRIEDNMEVRNKNMSKIKGKSVVAHELNERNESTSIERKASDILPTMNRTLKRIQESMSKKATQRSPMKAVREEKQASSSKQVTEPSADQNETQDQTTALKRSLEQVTALTKSLEQVLDANQCLEQVSSIKKSLEQASAIKKSLEQASTFTEPTIIPITDGNHYSCTQCHKTFNFSDSWNKHMISYHGKHRPYACEQCDFRCGLKRDLVYHVRTHTKMKSLFQCELCDKLFANDEKLKEHHFRVHNEIRPYQCNHCPESYSVLFDLKAHVRNAHVAERVFKCDICDKSYLRKQQLDYHKRTHDRNDVPICAICDKRFTNTWHLNLHMRSHTGEKVFKCDLCTEAFSHQMQLKSHLKKCHRNDDQVPYPKHYTFSCNFCEKKFSKERYLRVHLLELKHYTKTQPKPPRGRRPNDWNRKRKAQAEECNDQSSSASDQGESGPE